MAMVFLRTITVVLSLQTAMAKRFYKVVTTTSMSSFVDNYQESSAADLSYFKQESVFNPGVLCHSVHQGKWSAL